MSAPVDVLAVLDEAPSVSVAGVTVMHNAAPWRVATNRHPTIYGRAWGWIEGAPGNVCWSDDETFNRAAAASMVTAHAQWLEDQKPLSIRLVEARERYVSAKQEHDHRLKAYEAARTLLAAAEDRLSALARAQGVQS